MTDKELLELAAKAYLLDEHYSNAAYMRGFFSNWNPLTDDGDALRLAVELSIDIITYGDCVVARWFGFEQRYEEEWISGNPHAATRRAVVRAAAEIGKVMELAEKTTSKLAGL